MASHPLQLRIVNRQVSDSDPGVGTGAIAVESHSPSTWTRRYGLKHGYQRIPDQAGLRNGRRGRVTIYQRGTEPDRRGRYRYVLSWSLLGRRRKEALLGDCFMAVARADEINREIANRQFKGTSDELALPELIDAFATNLMQRAYAGDIAPGTTRRYRSALGHLLDFEQNPNRGPWRPTRDFPLEFKTNLIGKQVAPNGHANAQRRPLRQSGIAYILSAVSALIRWAVESGKLPGSVLSVVPQLRLRRKPTRVSSDAPITTEQVVRLMDAAADVHELLPIALMAYHGIRPSEAAWLMAERVDFENGWTTYAGIEELGYRTKGNTEKRLPLPVPLRALLNKALNGRRTGPVLVRTRDRSRPIAPLTALCAQVRNSRPQTWSDRQSAARRALRASGGVNCDDLRRLFRRLAKRAGLDPRITPKAFRHHFATALEKAGVGYYTRRYMLGHAVSDRGRRDVTAVYTHVDDERVRRAYQRVLSGPLRRVGVQVYIRQRS